VEHAQEELWLKELERVLSVHEITQRMLLLLGWLLGTAGVLMGMVVSELTLHPERQCAAPLTLLRLLPLGVGLQCCQTGV
jgi:hypothetical protein